jgi:hypothetical protein
MWAGRMRACCWVVGLGAADDCARTGFALRVTGFGFGFGFGFTTGFTGTSSPSCRFSIEFSPTRKRHSAVYPPKRGIGKLAGPRSAPTLWASGQRAMANGQ